MTGSVLRFVARGTDNLQYGFIAGRSCLIIDPVDADQWTDLLRDQGLIPVGIGVTHIHPDHIAGVPALAHRYGLPVWVGAAGSSVLAGVTDLRPVGEGDSLQLGASAVRVMEMPGHHPSHIGFAWQDVWAIGDVLFLAGCGNTRFGGDMEALYETIWNRVRRAPPETRLAWGHDYAEANLRFAERIEPHNPAIAETAAAVAAARSKGQELPWRTVADERAINPFLRLDEPAVVAGAIREAGLAPSDTTPRSVFRALRNLRNAV